MKLVSQADDPIEARDSLFVSALFASTTATNECIGFVCIDNNYERTNMFWDV